MDEDKPPPEFMSALVTDHFVLQRTSSSTISESGSRVSIYLSALSSGLVAIGFASTSHKALEALAFTVLPVVFVLGWSTVVRLTDTGVANIVSQRRMDLIRRYNAAIYPPAAVYFGPGDPGAGTHGVRYGRWSFLFTMASMVIAVNSSGGRSHRRRCLRAGRARAIAVARDHRRRRRLRAANPGLALSAAAADPRRAQLARGARRSGRQVGGDVTAEARRASR